MKNFLTSTVESVFGIIFIVVVTGFFVGVIFIAVKNFNSDIAIAEAQSGDVELKYVSQTERELINTWIADNNMTFPEGKGYRYIIKTYPDKPWLANSNLN